jgi:hypothetical protein
VTGYDLFVNGSRVGSRGGPSYTFAGLRGGTSYPFGVAARDAAGNVSPVVSVGGATLACAIVPGVSCAKVASPGASVQSLLDAASPGQTICLHGGTYSLSGSFAGLNVTRGGVAGAPITLTSYPGERATLTAAGAYDELIFVADSANYVTFDGLSLDGAGTGASLKIIGDNVVVSNDNITTRHLGRQCLLLGGSEGRAVAGQVVGNTIHGCGQAVNDNHDHCIYAAKTNGLLVQRNLIYDCYTYAIQMYPDAQGTLFDHNTVDGSGSIRGGVLFGGESSPVSSNNTVSNNILTYATTYELTYYWGGPAGVGNTALGNCLWGAASGDVSSLLGFSVTANTHADPKFVNAAAHDYTLQDGSPCTGKGA